jgi:hypothetical protein
MCNYVVCIDTVLRRQCGSERIELVAVELVLLLRR